MRPLTLLLDEGRIRHRWLRNEVQLQKQSGFKTYDCSAGK